MNTYSTFKAQSVKHDNANAAPLTASNLIKFGEVTETLGTAVKQTIVVPLTQVAARVDVTYNVTIGSGWTTELENNTVNGINIQSKIFLPEYDINGYNFGTSTLGNKSNVVISENKISFYTYEKNEAVTIMVPVKLSYNSLYVESKIYQLSLLPTYVKDKCSTNGFVHGHYYEVTGNLSIDRAFDCKIKWEVKSFKSATVTIPAFE